MKPPLVYFAKILFLTSFTLVVFDSIQAKTKSTFDQKAWLEDFDQLKSHVAKFYAHFDDKVASGVDPYALNIKTTKALKEAKSDREALIAMIRFVGAFRDGHFKIKNLRNIAPKVLGSPKRHVFTLRQQGSDVFVKEIEAKGCPIKAGDKVTAWNGQPIEEAVTYAEGYYTAFNDLNRRDLALAYLTKGYLIDERVKLGVVRSGKAIECEFSAMSEKKKTDAKHKSSQSESAISDKTPAGKLCQSLGIRERVIEPAPLLDQKLFKKTPNPTFKVGQIGEHGYLFIPAFGLYGYRQTCEREWDEYRKTFTGECDKDCQWKFEYNVMRQVLTDDLEKAIESINKRKLKKLVVDVTNNGGGSDWVDTAARVVSPRPLDCQKVARIKTEDLRRDYLEIKTEILNELKSNAKKSAKPILQKSVSNIETVLSDFRMQCDRADYWNKSGFKPKCDALTKRKLFACGYVPYVKPGALNDIKIRQPIFKSSDFQYQESSYKGEVVVLINRNTSSSAEMFVSLIRDNIPNTKVIGEHSSSTGCGYMNGGNPTILKNSGLKVNLSNCVRYQKDGTNEVFGIHPNIKLNWKETGNGWAQKYLGVTK